MDDILSSARGTDDEMVEINEWSAEKVEINDSISMLDCEEYHREIDRCQRQCARLEDPCPGVPSLGQPDEMPLERTYSF